MLFFVIACLTPAFVISFASTAAMRKLAPKCGLVDQPAARKVHETPTPLGGGIGIWLGVVVPLAIAQLLSWIWAGSPPTWIPAQIAEHLDGFLSESSLMWGIIAGGTVLSVMGLIDDLRDLPWLPRLLVQLCVAAALVAGGVQATVFVQWPWIGWGLTWLWILVLINSFNFLDNMDGLSAGIALIVTLLFAAIMLLLVAQTQWLVGGFLLVLAGALAGFLYHNRSPARIFMGDSGSYFIGMLIACMTVLGTFYDYKSPTTNIGGGSGKHVILAPLCILAIPLYDFCSVMIIRISQGRSPFHPDKSHFSHRLVEMGLSRRHAVWTVYLATLTTGLGALLLYRVDAWADAALVVALIACVLAIIAILETVGRKT